MHSRISLQHVELGHVDSAGHCVFLSQSICSLHDSVSLALSADTACMPYVW